jgi:hypothetical protein
LLKKLDCKLFHGTTKVPIYTTKIQLLVKINHCNGFTTIPFVPCVSDWADNKDRIDFFSNNQVQESDIDGCKDERGRYKHLQSGG